MYSKDTQRKASKGSVQVKVSNGRLQLVFSHAGKRHYLSLGYPDSKQNRRIAEGKAKLIESDIAYERFDPTLARYKPQSALSTVTPEIAPISVQPSLAELWTKFVEYKRPQCSPNTMYCVYGVYTGYVKKLPTHDLSRATEIRDFALKTFPIESCKRFIVRLNACCNWAVKSGLIDANPFSGMAAEIKPPKSQKSEDEDIDPFSTHERDRIIEAIANSTFCNKHSGFKHAYYTPLVHFLFSTGSRPSEAVALQWKHVTDNLRFINFEQAVIWDGRKRALRQGLKTQERRKFPCNPSLQALLKSIKPEHCNPESLVFPGFHGAAFLDLASFRKNVWKPVLEGLGIQYRKVYQTRHTFITLALENGLDAKDVARLVGNSPEVIYRHYAGNKRELFVPEF